MTDRARIILVTGGARSGKSALAERLVMRHPGPWLYVATAWAGDGEMAARIAAHQARRGDGWHTVEEPRDLDSALAQADGRFGAVLVDCLTLWLSNWYGADAPVNRLCARLHQMTAPVVLVTNEIGGGIVPADAAVRAFRDAHGAMNAAVADAADQVWLAVCGQPLRIKPGRDVDEIL
ncbi:MAG: bifunctional adenosylcobinamide kinase/adenosylcobinamide-phosphate guanylyltransferase [Paracoccus sp. (in: a-proteobacteria)]|nr:bifunctional adenosylcobinamide kinase/adenosylcobinamide-phosphate guanylyltransferase [Paracoccus sp. (in: a-proteobacteria)]